VTKHRSVSKLISISSKSNYNNGVKFDLVQVMFLLLCHFHHSMIMLICTFLNSNGSYCSI